MNVYVFWKFGRAACPPLSILRLNILSHLDALLSYHGAVASSLRFRGKFGVEEVVHGPEHKGIHVQMHHLQWEDWKGKGEQNQ